MLSLSADISHSSVDLQMINGDEAATAGDVAHAKALMNFAEAIARRDETALLQTRQVLEQEAGAAVVVDAAAVAGNFQRMVRIADSTGIPLDTRSAALSTGVRRQLGLERFASAQNTPADSWKIKALSVIARPLAKRVLKKFGSKGG